MIAALDPVVVVSLTRVGDGARDVDALLGELDDAERQRAARFRSPLDRERFVVGHVLLRRSAAERERQRTLSHAGRLVAVAVAPPDLAVGIDVEPLDPRRLDRAVAERYLTPDDVHAIDVAAPEDRARLFARAWTGLEAEAKARRTSLDALRGRPRTGRPVEIEADPEHVVSLWTASPVTVLRVDRRLLASGA